MTGYKLKIYDDDRKEYLIEKIKSNPKLAKVVHLIIDAIHECGEGMQTILPGNGPVVIIDGRPETKAKFMKFADGLDKSEK